MAFKNFKLETDADGIVLVTWDTPGRSMNVLDETSVTEAKLLEGDGKKRRHLKLTVPTDLKRKKVREFVLQALAATVAVPRQRRAKKTRT